MILAVRSDKPLCEISLLDLTGKVKAHKSLEAGHTLAKILLGEIDDILQGDFTQLTGLVVFKGPGSFTGLRIGLATMNALADGCNLPIVATSGDDWLSQGIARLVNNENDKIALPDYGAAPNITRPKH